MVVILSRNKFMEWEEIAKKYSPVKIESRSLRKKECSCINPIVKEKSFNEDLELDYDKIGHRYLYNGKVLGGTTDYVEKLYPSFKIDMIAKSSANNWKVDAQDIADLWESNGRVSSEFGTAIHNALEHYERYKEMGAKIQKIRGTEENYALPKHPTLKKIVQEFVDINTVQGQVLTEQLITDIKNLIAGRADRITIIDKNKKICRVGDYKINLDAEKKESKLKAKGFEDLPANKITKYQIQMSIYANMLQNTGWTVLGLDAYVYENGWKYFSLPILKII